MRGFQVTVDGEVVDADFPEGEHVGSVVTLTVPLLIKLTSGRLTRGRAVTVKIDYSSRASQPVSAVYGDARSVLVSQGFWGGGYYLNTRVTMAQEYSGRTMGLCGNFNYDPRDDFATPDGELVNVGTCGLAGVCVAPMENGGGCGGPLSCSAVPLVANVSRMPLWSVLAWAT